MDQSQNKNTTEEVKNQSITATESPSNESAAPIETQEQINWKRFRDQREQERKQKEAAERVAVQKSAEAEALKAALDAVVNKAPSSRDQTEDDDSEEVVLERKIQVALEKRERAKDLEREKREVSELPYKLNQAYGDFDKVCSSENLDYLEYHYPEVVAGYKNQPDSFDKWSNIYRAAKRFIPNTSSSREQNKAEKNFNKPQSMSVPGATQTGDHAPMLMDDKRKESNWRRMQAVMRGVKS